MRLPGSGRGAAVHRQHDAGRELRVGQVEHRIHDVLRRAYAAATDISTDDAGLVERIGETVHTIVGDALAFKITTPHDLLLAEALL